MPRSTVAAKETAPATAAVADACLREGIECHLAPNELRAVWNGPPVSGPALAVKHEGSVDVFLEAFESAAPGQVLVIDNAGRHDEACIGDLTALEAQQAGIAGAVVWGRHRDTEEIRRLEFPVFSLGPWPAGPNRSKAVRGTIGKADVGGQVVRSGDFVVADADGVLFLPARSADAALRAAREIADRERRQAEAVAAGETLRKQFRFAEYLKKRDRDPTYTLREHLRSVGGEIEV